MHSHVGKPQFRNGRKHFRVILSGGNVVDNYWPEYIAGFSCDFASESVYGDFRNCFSIAESFRSHFRQPFKRLLQVFPLLGPAYRSASRTGGASADVYNICPVLNHLEIGFLNIFNGYLATIPVERLVVDVYDSHHFYGAQLLLLGRGYVLCFAHRLLCFRHKDNLCRNVMQHEHMPQ